VAPPQRVGELERAIAEFLDAYNSDPNPSPGPKARIRFWPASPLRPTGLRVEETIELLPNTFRKPTGTQASVNIGA
jgi:hypothetical protein